MTDSTAGTDATASNTKPDVKPRGKPNPMWKYMGFGENFRPKLPSRNWLIFLSITGSFTAAVIYDKREKRRVQRKWCKLVEHIAKEPLDPRYMPRKLTVFLEGPPADGLRSAQDHFKEYVKPILVASGLDWEFIQGRKEGDIRAELAEKIRKQRTPIEQQEEVDTIMDVRRKSGIQEFQGPAGDIVIGRHTWKEYVRGLHEGWLGPISEPPKPAEESVPEEANLQDSSPEAPSVSTLDSLTGDSGSPTSDDPSKPSSEAEPPKESEKKVEDDKPKKPSQPAPFISTLAYPSAPTPHELPTEFSPSAPISFPHILGFLNTPRRLYRFLNRRELADQIGRETAAIILCSYRPYQSAPGVEMPSSFTADENTSPTMSESSESESGPTVPQTAEQQSALFEEEKEWHKSARVRVEGEPERTWLEPIVLDPRIASRMRRSELGLEDEERARKIVVPEVEVEGWIKGGIRSLGKSALGYFAPKEKRPVYVEDEE
ncbi:mitochondrial import inner membrane translocase subunit Tim54 [Tricladium varicosporioides]|nr:mitochondrial import inner membrane translocase subunit Tim54 [Hymenoscyphus varicosporioides]